MRSVLLALPLVLASCSGAPPRYDAFPSVVCEKLLGREWTTLPAPPANSERLLGLLNRPHLLSADALWFRGAGDTTAVCVYGTDVCGSEAHVFHRRGAEWIVDDSSVAVWLCVA